MLHAHRQSMRWCPGTTAQAYWGNACWLGKVLEHATGSLTERLNGASPGLNRSKKQRRLYVALADSTSVLSLMQN